MKQRFGTSLAILLVVLMLFSVVVYASDVIFFEGYRVVNVLVNGKSIESDVPAINFKGRTMVPLRFIGEALGAEVIWEQSSFTAKILSLDSQVEEHEKAEVNNGNTSQVRNLTRSFSSDRDSIIELDSKIEVEIISLVNSKGEFLSTGFEVKNDGGNTKILISQIPKFTRSEKYKLKILTRNKEELIISLNFVEESVFVGGNFYKIMANPSKGFNYDYYLYVPKNYKQNENAHLLVESNNTGTVSNDISVHEEAVNKHMSVNSFGKNVADSMEVPYLMPVFIRPEKNWNHYTHDLDRETMLAKLSPQEKEELGNYERIDLQLVKMIEDAQEKLRKNNLKINDKILMIGYSASAKFANKFSLLHPEKIQAISIGGINGATMLPVSSYKNTSLRYPLGTSDFEAITGKPFNYEAYKEIKQFLYMGAKDNNDVTEYRDGWNEEDAKTWWSLFGKQMMPTRWDNLQEAYSTMDLNIQLHTYTGIGHMITNKTIEDTIRFLKENLGKTFNKITPHSVGL